MRELTKRCDLFRLLKYIEPADILKMIVFLVSGINDLPIHREREDLQVARNRVGRWRMSILCYLESARHKRSNMRLGGRQYGGPFGFATQRPKAVPSVPLLSFYLPEQVILSVVEWSPRSLVYLAIENSTSKAGINEAAHMSSGQCLPLNADIGG